MNFKKIDILNRGYNFFSRKKEKPNRKRNCDPISQKGDSYLEQIITHSQYDSFKKFFVHYLHYVNYLDTCKSSRKLIWLFKCGSRGAAKSLRWSVR